jgi:cytochrome c6
MSLKTILISLLMLLIQHKLMAQKSPIMGKDLYETNCSRCHGKEGTKHLFGAKDLKKSVLDSTALVTIVQNGKRFMPAYKSRLTADELKQVMGYVKSLRQ